MEILDRIMTFEDLVYMFAAIVFPAFIGFEIWYFRSKKKQINQ